ncbi:hypothetical protein BT96DRAFT_917986, partial [Gymnopus androsaceus JB14]
MHTKFISSILAACIALASASSLLPRQTNDTCLASGTNACTDPDGCFGTGDLREFVWR